MNQVKITFVSYKSINRYRHIKSYRNKILYLNHNFYSEILKVLIFIFLKTFQIVRLLC